MSDIIKGVDQDGQATAVTVKDYVNANPVAVVLVDTNGDPTSVGAGTQYTEDAAAAGNPVGNAQILVRADTPAGIVSADGDNVAQRGTNYGAAFVQSISSAGALIDYQDRLTDNVGVALQTDVILSDTTALTPKFKRASVAAGQTDSSLIAAVPAKKLRVLAMRVMVGATATDSTFESDGGADTILHEGTYGANGGEVLPFNPVGWFETIAGEALVVTTGAGSTTKYTIVYVEV